MGGNAALHNVLFLLGYMENCTEDIKDKYSLMVTFYEGLESTAKKNRKDMDYVDTVSSNCTKDIGIDNVEKFLNLVYDWLNKDSQELRSILMQKAYSIGCESSVQIVNSFFGNA